MGTTYQNVTVFGAEREAIASVLRDLALAAYITPTRSGVTVVFPQRGDAWDSPDAAADVAGSLSHRLGCPTLVAGVFDDDIVVLSLFEGLERTFEYNSSERRIAHLARLRRAAGGRGSLALLWLVLKLPHMLPYFIESFRHLHVLKVLGLPLWSFAIGYTNIRRARQSPVGLAAGDLVET